LGVTLKLDDDGWKLKANGDNASLVGTTSPVTVDLVTGNDVATTRVTLKKDD
jgi:hypothetical protein